MTWPRRKIDSFKEHVRTSLEKLVNANEYFLISSETWDDGSYIIKSQKPLQPMKRSNIKIIQAKGL